MFIYLSWLSLIPLFLPARAESATGVRPDVLSSTIVGISIDSAVVPVPLTADVLTRYIAVKQDLGKFWQSHAALLQEAQAHAHHDVYDLASSGMRQHVGLQVFDYPTLTAQEPALAAIFKAHAFLPAQFEPTQTTVYQALFDLAAIRATHVAPSFETTSVRGKNMLLAQQFQRALGAVGIAMH